MFYYQKDCQYDNYDLRQENTMGEMSYQIFMFVFQECSISW